MGGFVLPELQYVFFLSLFVHGHDCGDGAQGAEDVGVGAGDVQLFFFV